MPAEQNVCPPHSLLFLEGGRPNILLGTIQPPRTKFGQSSQNKQQEVYSSQSEGTSAFEDVHDTSRKLKARGEEGI